MTTIPLEKFVQNFVNDVNSGKIAECRIGYSISSSNSDGSKDVWYTYSYNDLHAKESAHFDNARELEEEGMSIAADLFKFSLKERGTFNFQSDSNEGRVIIKVSKS